jgi:hypothetical protein
MRTTKPIGDFGSCLLAAALAVAIVGCGRTGTYGSTPGEDAAAGVSIGHGGDTASGGRIGTGGLDGTGGVVATGGAASSGGILGHGGTSGAGGTVGRGGMAGSGAGTASAGTAGKGGAIGTGGIRGQGGAIASGGIGGWRAGTVVSPRPPSDHRPLATSCVGVHSPPEPTNVPPELHSECKKHADCTGGKNGKCVHGIGMASLYYYCVYDQCDTDANCDASRVCYCLSSANARCLLLGNCRTDGDCGGGDYSYCSPSMGFDCGGYHSIDSYYCHTPKDTCMDDSDCTGTDYCNFDPYDGRWKCAVPNMTCIIG